MKIFRIENKEGRIFYVRDKKHFCEKFNLTPRLLEYTLKGSSKTRWQEWHKEYKITEKCNFVESTKGDIILWDSGTCGFVSPMSDKTAEDRVEDINSRINGRITFNDEENQKVSLANPTLTKTLEELDSTQKMLRKTLREKQKLHDKLLILNRLGREQYRYESLSDIIKDTFSDLIGSNVPIFTKKHEDCGDKEAILMLSDLHIGQLVEESNNSYDLKIAYSRLGSIFNKFIAEAYSKGVTTVTLTLLGDLIHAQSVLTKPDMKLSAEFPEVQATIECFKLLAHHIDELITHFSVKIVGVVGNESRFSNHYIPSNLQKEAKNNLDTLIFAMLMERYKGMDSVTFLNEGDEIETVITVKGHNILLTHGNANYVKHSNLEDSFVKANDRLGSIYGELSAMLIGHIHSTLITDRVYRNASLTGSNAYSNYLGFSKTPISQNMLIISDDEIYGFAIKP